MYTSRSILFTLICALGVVTGPVFAHSGEGTSSYGGMPMMGAGGGMMGFGAGGMMGPGAGMSGTTAPEARQLGDERLDQIGERIAARYQLMQEIASEDDKSARRDLVRQYFGKVHSYGRDNDADDDTFHRNYGRRGWGYGPMGPGMMGYGPMGYGMMGPGMMGYGRYQGMGPGMMHSEKLSDEQLDEMAAHMAEGYKDMQQIAQTTDKAERRKLLREHFKDMRQFWQNQ